MLSFLISTFFTRAKTAVAVGTLSFLAAFFPYYTVNDQGVSMLVSCFTFMLGFTFIIYCFWLCIKLTLCTCRVLKAAASLLSPTAFALGLINFADYERAHVGLRWSNIWRVSKLST